MQPVNVKNFTDRITALQKRMDVSDSALARELGISRQLLYLMRSGERLPSKKTCLLIEKTEQKYAPESPDQPQPTVQKNVKFFTSDREAVALERIADTLDSILTHLKTGAAHE